MRRFRVRVKFVPQDMWVGLFWKRYENSSPQGCDPIVIYYVCIVPMLPITVERYR